MSYTTAAYRPGLISGFFISVINLSLEIVKDNCHLTVEAFSRHQKFARIYDGSEFQE